MRYIVHGIERVNEAPRRWWEVSSSAWILPIVFPLSAMFDRIEVMWGLVFVSKVWREAINNAANRACSLSHTTLRRGEGCDTEGRSICNYEKGRSFGDETIYWMAGRQMNRKPEQTKECNMFIGMVNIKQRSIISSFTCSVLERRIIMSPPHIFPWNIRFPLFQTQRWVFYKFRRRRNGFI